MRIPTFLLPLTAAAFCLSVAQPAQAELQACNETRAKISVAFGYKDSEWTSEGWWTMLPGDCRVMVAGDLKHRYYYWRATQDGVALPSGKFQFCTSPKAFTIVGDTNCEARGHDTATFSEVDTGDAQSYTITVSGSASGTRAPTDEFADVRAAIQGNWYVTARPDYRVFIQGNRMTVADNGAQLDPATFEIAQVCPESEGDGPVLLMNYIGTPGADACWLVVNTGQDLLHLYVYDTGADVQMKRQTR